VAKLKKNSNDIYDQLSFSARYLCPGVHYRKLMASQRPQQEVLPGVSACYRMIHHTHIRLFIICTTGKYITSVHYSA